MRSTISGHRRKCMQDNPLRASDMRLHNKSLVLSRIHASQGRGVSQSELVQETGLKAPTIFRIFSALEEEGLIEPVQGGEGSGLQKKGRKPVSYAVCKDARYSIGLEFWAAYISIGVFDFRGDRIFSSMEPLGSDTDVDAVMDSIVRMVTDSVVRLSIPRNKLLGIGVAAPGQVDLENQLVMYYPRIHGMKAYPIVKVLQERLRMPVLLHNNCSAIAFSEYRYGGFDNKGSMFTFLLRSGVNGAFVHDDQIFLSSRGTTLETGHIPINFDGPRCACGSRGCLQAYLQDLDPDSLQSRLALFEGLEAPLRAGEPKALRTIERAAGYLLIAMKSIIRFLSPRTFLFVGCSETVSNAIADEVRRLFVEPDAFDADIPFIYAKAYDPLFAQKGASDLVLAAFFS